MQHHIRFDGGIAARIDDLAAADIDDTTHNEDSSKGCFFTALSNSLSVARSEAMRSRGQAFGPSDNAFAGSGCVSMNIPATPAATAARAKTGTNSRCPPETSPLPPGSCTECVASNTTGHPVSRMMASDRISDTRLLYPKEKPRSHTMICALPVERALSTTFCISHGDRNWPFLIFTGFPCEQAATMKLVWRPRYTGVFKSSRRAAPM